MKTAFTTWKRDGVSFLAFPTSTGVIVLDEHGNNYGGWQDAERFRKLQSAGDPITQPLPGVTVQLSGRIVQTA